LRKKIPELLVDGPLTVRPNFYAYKKVRVNLQRMEKRNWIFIDEVVDDLTKILQRLEKSLNIS